MVGFVVAVVVEAGFAVVVVAGAMLGVGDGFAVIDELVTH